MSKIQKFCCDRAMPQSHVQPRGMFVSQAILVRNKMWPNGSTLRVCFLEGSSEQQQQIKTWVTQWTACANLYFDFVDDTQADIRIGFADGEGSWSAVGTDARDTSLFPINEKTMNFGWQLDEGTVLHEFGHAIGLGHEHQNQQGGIQWNETKVISALSGAPNYWSPEMTRHNVLRKYNIDQINGTAFDPDSIMLYFFPSAWTKNGVSTHANTRLSNTDKNFISSRAAYPNKEKSQQALIRDIYIDQILDADIGQAGEEDLYRFVIREKQFYHIETMGKTDLVMRLYGPDQNTLLIAEDDDSGQAYNAKISRKLSAGTYLVQVRHFNPEQGTGRYQLFLSSDEPLAVIEEEIQEAIYYTVQRGDTLYGISRSQQQSVSNLIAWNHLSAPYTLNIGQLLLVG